MTEIKERVILDYKNKLMKGYCKKRNLKRQFEMLKGETDEK